MTQLSLVYITASSKEEAAKIGEELVSRRLAACANILDNMTSIYWWEEKLQKDDEAVLILKTKESLFPELKKAVKELHSYDCPCIVALPLEHVSEDYAEWVIRETK